MINNIRLAGIVEESIVDGPGIRIAIFMQGCLHQCYKCHNPLTWDLNGGKLYTFDQIKSVIASNHFTDGVTITGGDPFYQVDQLEYLLKMIKDEFNLNIIVYTGFLYEEIIEKAQKDKRYMNILKHIDILVDGPYIDEKRDLSLLHRGSSNQRVIDVNLSLNNNDVVLANW